MKPGALLDLLTRRLTFWLVAMILVPAAMALVPVFADETKSAGMVIGLSLYVCALLGNYLGSQIVLAIGCSFAWTLPHFRRNVLREFVVCGIAVAAMPGLVVAATTGAPMSALLASVAGLAAFSVSGALSLIPEAQPVVWLGWLAFIWFPTLIPSSVLNAPLVVIPIALAISMAALYLGFGSRSFRWAVLNARESPVGPISFQLHTVLRLPKRGPKAVYHSPTDTSRTPYIGTAVVRGVAYSYEAIKRRWLFVNLVAAVVLFAVMTASFVWLNRATDGPAASPNLWFGLVMIGALFSFFGHRGCSRVALPWSRRQHLAVAYTIDLIDTLGFLLATCPLAIAVFIVIAHADASLVESLARAGAATAVFLPVFQWPGEPPTGGQGLGQFQSMSVLLFVRPVVIVAAVALVVYGLPVVVSSLAAQALVMSLLLVVSQSLYWLKLRRAFTTRDLVGETR
jgi:hypothetical protein